MSNQLQAAASWLAGVFKANESQLVTYRRGNLSVQIQATLDAQLLRVDDAKGQTKVERTDRDFIITAADLRLAGQAVTPERGDYIDLPFAGVIQRFVAKPYGKDAAWRYEDATGFLIRIHTGFVGNVG